MGRIKEYYHDILTGESDMDDYMCWVSSKLSDMDREWAALAAGRPVSDDEALEFKREYETWAEGNI